MFVIKNLLNQKCIDIHAISETWLKENDSDNYINVIGYSVIRKDRYGKRGGGVCLYIRKPLKYRVLYTSNTTFDNQPEFIFVEISLSKMKLLCSVIFGEQIENLCTFI